MDTASILRELAAIVGDNNLRTDAGALQHYGTDRTTEFRPDPLAIVFPRTTELVQQLVLCANRHGFKLVPSGGRSGLCGGAVAAQREVVLSLEKMNHILEFNAMDRLVRCEAGVITKQLQEFAAAQHLFFPVDLASSGSSCIGGNIATNAGGNRVLRYGMMRQWVRGLTVITGRGDRLQLNRGLKKNNAGYDLMQLFIGSEGTLAIICEAELELIAKPDTQTVLCGLDSFPQALALFAAMQNFESTSAVRLASVEYFSGQALAQVMQHQGLKPPFATRHVAYVLLEIETPVPELEQLQEFLAGLEPSARPADIIVATRATQASALWRYREGISEAIAPRRPVKNDIAVRPSRLGNLVDKLEQLLEARPGWQLVLFGHLGDGNLHVNLLPGHEARADEREQLTAEVIAQVMDAGGSLSAEHGIGLTKRHLLDYHQDHIEHTLMQELKTLFDPANILNPGKVIQQT